MTFATEMLNSAIEQKKEREKELLIKMLGDISRILRRLRKRFLFKEGYLFAITRHFGFFENLVIDLGFIGLEAEKEISERHQCNFG